MPINSPLKSLASVRENRQYIGANSATINSGDIVTLSGGFVSTIVATGQVEGIAQETKTFASDNQTVAKAKISVVLPRKGQTFSLTCNSASLAQADVGAYFLLASGNTVDYATKRATTAPYIVNTSDAGAATDPVLLPHVRLVEYVGQNTSIYEFVIPA